MLIIYRNKKIEIFSIVTREKRMFFKIIKKIFVLQNDCFQGHEHKFTAIGYTGQHYNNVSYGNNWNPVQFTTTDIVEKEGYNEPRYEKETRSINATFKIWKRIN